MDERLEQLVMRLATVFGNGNVRWKTPYYGSRLIVTVSVHYQGELIRHGVEMPYSNQNLLTDDESDKIYWGLTDWYESGGPERDYNLGK